ncbi:MAG: tetratricopeptide repeat protein, partial [Anaerolineae bacterium]|nr:tetratricopeptide repeat protein [Anaerolineae bacterium]
MAIPPDVWEGIKTTAEIAANTFLAIRAQSKKIVPKPPPRPEPKYIERHDREGRDLVGRVNAQLQEGKMLTLTGAGGVGKTTIAIEVANRLFEKRIGAFKEGIVWISADGRPDFGLVSLVDNVLDQLVPVDQVETIRRLPLDAKRELARRLLAERKRCLLALDNFETIPEKEQGLIVAYLAELPCPKLVTSRKPLPKGEEIAVGPMTPKEARAFLQMRVERSEQPERLRGVDWDEVAKVADYNPMLMRWVVAQLEQAMRPQDVFDEIARGKGEAPERIFYQTFNNLGEDGQMALLALALFVPTASREALAAACGFEDGKDRVNEAVRRLAAFDLLDTAVEGDRLGIVALTRRLTDAQLKRDERTEGLKERFVAHFLAYAEDHPEVTKEDLDALDEERENLLAALDYAYAAEDWESVIAITDTIAFPGLLDIRGYWDEAIKWGERAAEVASQANLPAVAAGFSGDVGTIRYQRGDYAAARKAHQKALTSFEQAGDAARVAVALHQLGIVAQLQGDYQEARDLYIQCLEISRKLEDQRAIASSLHQLGIIAYLQGDYQQARRLNNQCLEIKRDLGDQAGIAMSLHQLGMLAQHQGDYQQAKELCNQSLEIKRDLGDQAGIATSLGQLGIIAYLQG